jgi:hypothetical protein
VSRRFQTPYPPFIAGSDDVVATFSSQSEASRVTGIPRKHISNCCLGRRESAGNFRWRTLVEPVAEVTASRLKYRLPAASSAYDGSSEGEVYGGAAAAAAVPRSLRAQKKRPMIAAGDADSDHLIDGGRCKRTAFLSPPPPSLAAGVEPTTRLPYDLLCLAALGRASHHQALHPPAAVAASLLCLVPSLRDGLGDARRAAEIYEQVVRATLSAAVVSRSPDVLCGGEEEDAVGLTDAGKAKYAALQQLFSTAPLSSSSSPSSSSSSSSGATL